MDQQTAHYIITYYPNLMSDKEKMAWKHFSTTSKLAESNNPELLEMCKRKGWISEDREILVLLENGYDHFERSTAQRILQNFPEEVFLNVCPKCGKLARTPSAKQCRFCGLDWRNEGNSIRR
ncbi:hypothetical protein [Flavobacterium sp.]|uniref:hypothetical protein n=1 Tax=Flavobacterium sp. TaxID=239 RepID=UPI0039E24480